MDREESLLGTVVSWENVNSRPHQNQYQEQHLQPITPTINTPLLHLDPQISSSNDTPKQISHTLIHPRSSKIPRALSRLLPHNRPGLKKTTLIQPDLNAWGRRWRSYCSNAQEKINNTYRLGSPAGDGWETNANEWASIYAR